LTACHLFQQAARINVMRVRYRRAGGNGVARPESLWSGCKTRGSPGGLR